MYRGSTVVADLLRSDDSRLVIKHISLPVCDGCLLEGACLCAVNHMHTQIRRTTVDSQPCFELSNLNKSLVFFVETYETISSGWRFIAVWGIGHCRVAGCCTCVHTLAMHQLNGLCINKTVNNKSTKAVDFKDWTLAAYITLTPLAWDFLEIIHEDVTGSWCGLSTIWLKLGNYPVYTPGGGSCFFMMSR